MQARRCAIVALAVLLATLFARPAAAHQLDLSQGEYMLRGATLRASLVFASPDLAKAIPSLDDDHDGDVSQTELERHHGDVEEAIVRGLRVSTGGTSCPGVLDAASAIAGDSTRIDAHFTCPATPSTLALDFDFLRRFAPAHQHIATLRGRAPALVTRDAPHLDVSAAGGETERASFVGMFRTGIAHILTGYDHLAFLLALVLVGGRPRALVGVVTAFTVAHSMTLGLAALRIFAPSPRIVEPAIALSIAYVAVENVFAKDASRRWRITFPFGLVHGFGFASALAAVDLPRARVPASLLAFNLGVEAGQLAVLAVLAAPLYLLRRSAWFRDRGVKIASAALAAAGLALFVRRLFAP